jgi:parallel beta-helix repeat protein
MLIISSSESNSNHQNQIICNPMKDVMLSSYTTHDPIVITSNADFESQGWSGNGSKEDPYIIQGLKITSDEQCIAIENTYVYFEVKNCLFTGGDQATGISFGNVTFGSVSNCVATSLQDGFCIYSSRNCTLTNNSASSNSADGFDIISANCTFINNTANVGI